MKARRDFIRLALSAIPATGLLAGCATASDSAFEGPAGEPAVGAEPKALLGDCLDGESQDRRSRWLELHAAHIGCENQHDLPGIVASFGSEATMVVNELSFVDARSIVDAHTLLGMSSSTGGLSGTQVVPDREYFTDDELLIQGRVLGFHVGQVLQFLPTFRQVELHYAAFYRFDDAGELVSERIVMNWAPLAGA